MVFDIEEFVFCKGECVFVYGFSGCGKMMLFGVLVGVFEVDVGVVCILG